MEVGCAIMQQEVDADSLRTVNVEKAAFVALLGNCRNQLGVIEQESHDYRNYADSYHKQSLWFILCYTVINLM